MELKDLFHPVLCSKFRNEKENYAEFLKFHILTVLQRGFLKFQLENKKGNLKLQN